jgi:hypothetical protein
MGYDLLNVLVKSSFVSQTGSIVFAEGEQIKMDQRGGHKINMDQPVTRKPWEM